MRLHADDAGFVRAPIELVYRRITHVARWPDWWPGTQVRSLPPEQGDEVWAVTLRGRRGRAHRVAARCHSWRFHAGFSLALTGDLDGRAELWLAREGGGTVVHALLDAEARVRRPLRLLEDHRRAVRRGLWGLKETLEIEARTSAGLQP